MALAPGTRLGAYEVASLLGAGGMGEVYRARDTKLNRDVALKILPDAVTVDGDRIARFRREAQLLAALNHPNIAHIYGFEDSGNTHGLVLELVEGPTLADRIAKGPIPLDEALPIARQIAEALESAHEHGIIHRDLKPANIKLRPNGTVKVLDFGLAKAMAPVLPQGSIETGIETVVSPAIVTVPGLVLGTAAYMSPEQAKGENVDRRCDIWAFGVVCYEMLTGASPFQRPTTAETLASVLSTAPDYSRLPGQTSAGVRHLLRRCLEKDVRRRLQHMGDVRIEIEDTLTGVSATAALPSQTAPTATRNWRYAAGVLSLAGLAGAAGWSLAHRSSTAPSAAVIRLSIPSVERLPSGVYGARHLAIADDGSRVAYVSSSQLWIRPLGQNDSVAINAHAQDPFFSSDGKWLAFFDQRGLNKVPVLGGTPTTIVETSERTGGGTWRADGTIVFATTVGLYQVSESGGQARLLAKPDPQRNERGYAWPQFLPDGQAVLFTIVPTDSIDAAQIAVLDLKTLETRVVVRGGNDARYLSTGHLVYASGRGLKAVAFDAQSRRTLGEPVALPDVDVPSAPDNGAAEFALSATGTLFFVSASLARQPLRTLAWVDREGREQPLAIAPARYNYARVSPDGTRLALDISGARRNIWIFDLKRSTMARLTNGPIEDMLPVWSLDSQRVFFSSNRTGNFDVYSQAADGATKERVEYAGPGFQGTLSFTPDATRLLVSHEFKSIQSIDLSRPNRLEPVLHTGFFEANGQVSPDGHSIAYESGESGDKLEIFLRPFPNVTAQREKVSVNGGRFPLWAPKGGGELYFVDLDGHVMAVPIVTSPNLRLGQMRKLFDWVKFPPSGPMGRAYDISPVDGRFLITKLVPENGVGPIDISVVLNWGEELKQRVPVK